MKLFFLHINFELQSTFVTIREIIITYSFKWSSLLYIGLKKGKAWDINPSSLLQFHEKSLGYHLGCFLLQHHFEPQPRCEDHDVFHILTQYGIDTASEIAMQFWLYGNGKQGYYTLLAMGAGLLLYPDHYYRFKQAYINGSLHLPIHDINYKEQLHVPFLNFIPKPITHETPKHQ